MGLISWLLRADRNDQKGAAAPPVEFETGEDEFHGLNMKAALDAHANWKKRLEQTLAGSSGETLEVAKVASDNQCTLGQWLHGEGKQRFAKFSEYHSLIRSHAEFHLTAGEILCDAHDGNKESAQDKLRHAFRQKSDRVQLDLVRLYVKVRD